MDNLCWYCNILVYTELWLLGMIMLQYWFICRYLIITDFVLIL